MNVLKEELKVKDSDIKMLQAVNEGLHIDHAAAIKKMRDQVSGKSVAGTFRIDELDRVIFEQFNNDLPSRLDFVGKVLDWQRFSSIAKGVAD
jgi:hypothetical protein